MITMMTTTTYLYVQRQMCLLSTALYHHAMLTTVGTITAMVITTLSLLCSSLSLYWLWALPQKL